jgi:hypothetical protein
MHEYHKLPPGDCGGIQEQMWYSLGFPYWVKLRKKNGIKDNTRRIETKRNTIKLNTGHEIEENRPELPFAGARTFTNRHTFL